MRLAIAFILLATAQPAAADDTFACTKDSMTSSMGDTIHQEVSPGRCQWVIDSEAEATIATEESHRAALWNALRTRPLTVEELQEVAQYGIRLNTPNGIPYFADQKAAELQAALTIQVILQQKAK